MQIVTKAASFLLQLMIGGIWLFWMLQAPSWENLLIIYVVTPLTIGILLYLGGLVYGEHLVNNPNRWRPDDLPEEPATDQVPYEVDNFGFFTEIENERVKMLELGETFVDCIMYFPDHTFAGYLKGSKLKRSSPDYWKVVATPEGENDAHPISPYNWLSWKTVVFFTYRLMWWAWQHLVYQSTGKIFTGIWPLQTVRTYPLEYFKEVTTAEGVFGVKRRNSYSDHFRVGDFLFFVPIASLDTQDFVPVKAIISMLLRVINPYRAAYRSDDNWASRFYSRIASVVNEITNGMRVEDVIARSERAEESFLKKVQAAVHELFTQNGPFQDIGFQEVPDGLTIPDRSFKHKEDEKKYGAGAFARVEKQARITRAEGDAEAVRLNGKAVNDAGDGGIRVAEIEGRVRTAEAAGDRAVIIVGGGQTDPTLAAILAELRNSNRKDT